jgi:hypothetical protein
MPGAQCPDVKKMINKFKSMKIKLTHRAVPITNPHSKPYGRPFFSQLQLSENQNKKNNRSKLKGFQLVKRLLSEVIVKLSRVPRIMI